MRRLERVLLLLVLAIPASLALPSKKVAAGESCAMACDHGTGMGCCCASGGGGESLRRCPTPADWFLQSSATRAVAPAAPLGVAVPPLAGFLVLLTVAFLLRLTSERPDPVPKLLS